MSKYNVIPTVAILEDSPADTERIIGLVNEWSQERIPLHIAHFSKSEALSEWMQEHKPPALMFLDIELPSENGLDVARIIRQRGYKGDIVFSTSHTEYALDGYSVHPLHYLVKPVRKEGVYACLETAVAPRFFLYEKKDESIWVPFRNILYFESRGHYVEIHTMDYDIELDPVRKKLSQIRREDVDSAFAQCTRSVIVNLQKVRRFRGRELLLVNGETLRISSRYEEEVERAYARLPLLPR